MRLLALGFGGRSPRPRARRRRAQERVAERSRTVAAARLQPCEGRHRGSSACSTSRTTRTTQRRLAAAVMHWDPGKLRAHDRVAVSEAVANESVSQTRLAACVARQVYELALVAASRASRYALPEGDYDDVVCLSPPPTRSAGAPEALGEPWTARSSTARACGPSTPPPSRRAAAAGSPAEPSDDEVFCLAPPPTRSARTPEAPGEPSSSRFFSVAAAAAAAARPPRAAPRTRATTSSFACRLRRPRRGPGPRHRCRGRLSRPRASGRRRATLRPRRAPAPRTRAMTSDDYLSPPRHARRTAVRFRGGAEVAHVARRRAWVRSRPAAGRLARRAIAIAWVL